MNTSYLFAASALLVATAFALRAETPALRRENELVAAVLIGEAGGEGDHRSLWAVREVIDNRARLRHATRTAVVLAREQFSCLNKLTREELVARAKRHPRWDEALRVARSSKRTNYTSGALYYHRDTILPGWAMLSKPVAYIGRHKYYGRLS